ncbi:Protein-tyrosine phosphatase [Dictyocaulus viviparus]|uniref:Protein-tyrosine phosphatase n=1 Tax=Dictyocaulus viviparus TaxID=29172 RepID=A0A0D8Y217_DICVI|nr:Protein-tyrosine phosphatase [Dictyocaulus viviparus]
MTRVSIRDGKGSDYIHANYVKSEYLQNTFICTQGPMLSTIHDFWRMVVSEHVSHIIMLCETIEQGKMKCEQYWPTAQEGKMNVEEFLLTNVKISCNDNHVLRTTIEVQIGNSGARQLVKHHQWKTWPDKTVPKSLLAVFRILQMVRSTSNPIVVHCSAGVGRTGSMVAVEMCLQTLLAGQKLSLLETCRKLRDQRMHSVQVEVQYVFVAEAICEYGRAMGYWDDPKLHEQYAKFKAVFEEYVARLPQPAAVAAAAAQQAALALNAAAQNQQNAPVIPSPAPIVAVAPQQNIPAIPTPTNAQYPYPGIIQGPQYFAMPKPSAAPVDTTRGVPMTADLMRVAQTAAEFLRPQPANIVQPTNAEQTRAHQPVPAPLRAPQAAPCGLPRAPQSSAEQVRAQQTVPGQPRAPTLSGIPPVPQMATPAPKPSVQSAEDKECPKYQNSVYISR